MPATGRYVKQLSWLLMAVPACASTPRQAEAPPSSTPVLVESQADGSFSASAAESPPSSPTQGQAGSAEPDVAVSKDESLDLAVYTAAGVPDVGARWAPGDYAKAASALGQLSRANRLFLPREGSERSGALFSRLVARDNLAGLDDGSIPAAERWALALDYARAVPPLLGLYAFAAKDHAAFPREQVELVAYLIAVHGQALVLAPDASQVPTEQAEAISELKEVALAVFHGAGAMLNESARYRQSDQLRLASAMASQRSQLESVLSADDLGKLRELFATAARNARDERVRRVLVGQ